MPDWIVPALLALILVVVLWLALRRGDTQPTERLERELRDEIGRQAQASRADLGSLQQVLLAQSGDIARTQNEQIDSFRAQLAATQQQTDAALRRLSDVLAEQLRLLSETNERRQAEMRQAVEVRLQSLQEGNEKKLEQMRATVDEKLQSTLERRLGESFKLVAERLEQVHKGLGEMQGLARDVGSLSRVLTNVKTRGVFGEVQLAGLLDQVFTPEQYATNVITVPGRKESVEFAIRLPGQRSDGVPMWLPIDAKFPREDYERLVDAHERADPVAAEGAAKAIDTRLRLEAKTIREKYLAPPHTTDYAILFVPTEGLYAEALRRPGLVEAMQREHKVMLAGPTTLLATLTSLQMGFRTMALQQRSAEVWEVLGAVKTEFDRFGQALARVKSQTQTVLESIDKAQTRTRQMTKALKDVEALPDTHAQQLLLGAVDEDPIDAKGDAPSA
ncbi:MAG: DNA recombination protein RmuC [Burkholderiales bacterium]